MEDPRLLTDRNVWLATVRPNGKPHLIPIWFVWHNARFYICTQGDSVKIKNIQANPRVSVSLEDGNKPAVAEGTAVLSKRPYPDDIAALFQQKYNWDINAESGTDAGYTRLIEIAPQKWLKW
jgi:PPOX class probable F420-dependent enzyme